MESVSFIQRHFKIAIAEIWNKNATECVNGIATYAGLFADLP